MVGLMNVTGSGRLPCISGHSQSFYSKSYRPRKNQSFDFFWLVKLFEYSRKLSNHIWVFEFTSKNVFWKAHLLMRLRVSFFDTKSYGPRKFDSSVFKLSREIPSQIWILSSFEFLGCENSFCINGYAPFFLKKKYDSRKVQMFDLLTVSLIICANYFAKSDIIGLLETSGY